MTLFDVSIKFNLNTTMTTQIIEFATKTCIYDYATKHIKHISKSHITHNECDRQPSFKHQSMYCNNCHKTGHYTRNCFKSIKSYGMIPIRWCNEINDYKLLCIQKRYGHEYVEIMRGKYIVNNEIDINYLCKLIQELCLLERNYILNYDYDYLNVVLWEWLSKSAYMKTVHKNSCKSKILFNILKTGFTYHSRNENTDYEGKFISFHTLFNQFSCKYLEPHWEFIKGKRESNETSIQCAIRECLEEGYISPNNYQLRNDIPTIEETHLGNNNISYCNKYYICTVHNDVNIYYNSTITSQKHELRKVAWLSIPQIKLLLRQSTQSFRFNTLNLIQERLNKIN